MTSSFGILGIDREVMGDEGISAKPYVSSLTQGLMRPFAGEGTERVRMATGKVKCEMSAAARRTELSFARFTQGLPAPFSRLGGEDGDLRDLFSAKTRRDQVRCRITIIRDLNAVGSCVRMPGLGLGVISPYLRLTGITQRENRLRRRK